MRFYVKLDTSNAILRYLAKVLPGSLWRFNLWSVYDVDEQRYTHHRTTYYKACKYRDYYENGIVSEYDYDGDCNYCDDNNCSNGECREVT